VRTKDLVVNAVSKRDNAPASTSESGSEGLIHRGSVSATRRYCFVPRSGRRARVAEKHCRKIAAKWGNRGVTRSRRNRTSAVAMATMLWKIEGTVCASCSSDPVNNFDRMDKMQEISIDLNEAA